MGKSCDFYNVEIYIMWHFSLLYILSKKGMIFYYSIFFFDFSEMTFFF